MPRSVVASTLSAPLEPLPEEELDSEDEPEEDEPEEDEPEEDEPEADGRGGRRPDGSGAERVKRMAAQCPFTRL
jgi:hypothetical protein